uniref:hypothetical protein n=1 Tax=Prevotella sp. TaxID=59823 RepID=UPI004026F3C5
MNKLTTQLQQWLEKPTEERDWNEGAILLLQLTNNPIMYRNISLNPKGKAEFIEGKLRQFLKLRLDAEAHDEVIAMQEQVDAIVASRTEFSNKDTNPATDFKAGKRGDHDSLPDDIKALYTENLDIVRRMRELHLRLRLLSDSTKLVPASERKPLLGEFIKLDKKLHDNWNAYDHYVTSAESLEKAESAENKELQQEESVPSKPKSKPKKPSKA